ncbi:MAG: ATP-binding protein [Actinomycetota bacterium]
MDPGGVVMSVVAAAAALGAGVALGRRSHAAEMRRAQEGMKSAQDALDRGASSARQVRRVQDLILGTMQEGVLLLDGGWRTEFANDALERHLGNRPAALAQIFPLGARETVRAAAEERRPVTIEIEVGTPTRWLRVVATPAGDDGSVLVVVTDVTESRRIDSVRRDFVANASHELKTPAAAIQAAAETLRDAAADDPEAVVRFAAQLERDALRLSRIVMDLLDLSRLEAETDGHGTVDLAALIDEETERAAPASNEAGVILEIAPHPPAIVGGSARDLALLIRNLIDNAIRYTAEGGTVRVSLTTTERDAVLSVRDTGVGIPTKDLPRIFERFYRVDRARSRETGGTGLGLAIVKHVAENVGAHLAVESELGVGSTFLVRVPLAV